jgi:hypothetical protein
MWVALGTFFAQPSSQNKDTEVGSTPAARLETA